MKFSVLLKTKRLESKLSQTELANKLGLKTHLTIYRWEKGNNIPNFDSILAICNLFKIPLQTLIKSIAKEEKSKNENDKGI